MLGFAVVAGCDAGGEPTEGAGPPLPPPSTQPSQPAGTAPVPDVVPAADPDDVLDDELAAALEDPPSELATVAAAAEEHDVDPDLVAALAWHESRWDHDARSHAGAIGVMQVMPSTARRVSDRVDARLDPADVEDNTAAGVLYLAGLKQDFPRARDALIAYNMGSAQLREEGPLTESEEFADRVLETRDQLAQVEWEPTTAPP